MYIKFLAILLFFISNLTAQDSRAIYIKKFSNENKTALIIGNSDYTGFSKLKNSLNDAYDMKATLEQKGFKIHFLQNANLRQTERKIKEFVEDLKDGGVGMVFYAGHGLEVDGRNYLIPVDAKIEDKSEVKYEAYAVNQLIDKMEDAKNRLNILVLDACRNDPFSRSTGGGLAPLNNAKGMYVAYATAPGKVASDGSGKNGLFTKHLLNEIKKPQSLEQLFKNTRQAVFKESNAKQLPWTSSSVMGDFYFTVPSSFEKLTTNTKTQKLNLTNTTQDNFFEATGYSKEGMPKVFAFKVATLDAKRNLLDMVKGSQITNKIQEDIFNEKKEVSMLLMQGDLKKVRTISKKYDPKTKSAQVTLRLNYSDLKDQMIQK